MNLQLYTTCITEAWAPGFGDRDLYGYVMTVVHLVAAALAVTVAIRGPFLSRARRSERWLWAIGATVLVALAINKQLDLQSMAVNAARCVARAQGWYDTRRMFQEEVIFGLVIAAGILVPALLFALRRAIAGNLAFVVSLSALVVFVLLRAISFHHLDILFGRELLSFRLHRLIEMASLGAVIVTTAARLRRGAPSLAPR
jgi:uncharacterized membrane protein YhaH (DUF805 family)